MPHRWLALLALFAAVSSLPACFGSKGVHGKIEISPALKEKLSPSAVLYVIARPAGQTGGPPLAVKRFPQPIPFPVEFTLSSNDSMIPDYPLKGRVNVTARVAQSGAAIPVKPGDIEGRSEPGEISVDDDQPIAISLDHEVTQP